MKIVIIVLLILFSGLIAAYITIPLLASVFGVTLTVTGTSLVVGMYLYVLASLLVATGVGLCLSVVGFIFVGLVEGILTLLEK